MSLAVCADVGSTDTKVAIVDLAGGHLVATATHPTTATSDVLHGLDAAVAAALPPGHRDAPWYVCSSAGGGLRLAVIGYEELVTARAGRTVGLSAGARVVQVAAGRLDRVAVADLRAAAPDVVLLVGGTDGGDTDVITHNARRLAGARWRTPVVVAGNADTRAEVVATLAGRGVPVTATANVLPRIGVLDPAPARAAIREVFLRHVIGGKGLSRGPRFASLVRAATPDAVLTAVEALADDTGAQLAVVDIGGATTDVYSALIPPHPGPRPAADQAKPAPAVEPEVAGRLWRSRTVEGDLGLRWSATGVVAAAVAGRLLDAAEREPLAAAARRRVADPGWRAGTAAERARDRTLAALAATVALRRHGRDLSEVRLVIGSGGVLRHAPAGPARAVLASALGDRAGGWPLPREARVVIDTRYVLAAAGLLAGEHRAVAGELLRRHLSRGR